MKAITPSRLLAVKILKKVFDGELFDVECSIDCTSLEAMDCDFCRKLVLGTIEKNEELTERLDKVSIVKTDKMRPLLSANLKAALYQLLYLDAVPDFAAVNEAVTITKKTVSPSLAAFTNAVLRKAISEANNYHPETEAAKYCLPKSFISSLKSDYGNGNALKICVGYSEKTADVIRINPLKSGISSLKDIYGERISDLGGGAALFEFDGDIRKDKNFSDGLFYFQNASSQLCVKALSPRPEDCVLDCCAAPGGKSFTAAGFMENRGVIDCIDVSEEKVSKIKEGADRLGIDIINAEKGDAITFTTDRRYDRIICDVPCSGFGLLRKRPYIKMKDLSSLAELPEIQFAILSNVSKLLKEDGLLIYSTCTLRDAENGAVLRRFLQGGGFETVDLGVKGDNLINDNNMITVIPDGIYEGFFFAGLKRTGK